MADARTSYESQMERLRSLLQKAQERLPGAETAVHELLQQMGLIIDDLTEQAAMIAKFAGRSKERGTRNSDDAASTRAIQGSRQVPRRRVRHNVSWAAVNGETSNGAHEVIADPDVTGQDYLSDRAIADYEIAAAMNRLNNQALPAGSDSESHTAEAGDAPRRSAGVFDKRAESGPMMMMEKRQQEAEVDVGDADVPGSTHMDAYHAENNTAAWRVGRLSGPVARQAWRYPSSSRASSVQAQDGHDGRHHHQPHHSHGRLQDVSPPAEDDEVDHEDDDDQENGDGGSAQAADAASDVAQSQHHVGIASGIDDGFDDNNEDEGDDEGDDDDDDDADAEDEEDHDGHSREFAYQFDNHHRHHSELDDDVHADGDTTASRSAAAGPSTRHTAAGSLGTRGSSTVTAAASSLAAGGRAKSSLPLFHVQRGASATGQGAVNPSASTVAGTSAASARPSASLSIASNTSLSVQERNRDKSGAFIPEATGARRWRGGIGEVLSVSSFNYPGHAGRNAGAAAAGNDGHEPDNHDGGSDDDDRAFNRVGEGQASAAAEGGSYRSDDSSSHIDDERMDGADGDEDVDRDDDEGGMGLGMGVGRGSGSHGLGLGLDESDRESAEINTTVEQSAVEYARDRDTGDADLRPPRADGDSLMRSRDRHASVRAQALSGGASRKAAATGRVSAAAVHASRGPHSIGAGSYPSSTGRVSGVGSAATSSFFRAAWSRAADLPDIWSTGHPTK